MPIINIDLFVERNLAATIPPSNFVGFRTTLKPEFKVKVKVSGGHQSRSIASAVPCLRLPNCACIIVMSSIAACSSITSYSRRNTPTCPLRCRPGSLSIYSSHPIRRPQIWCSLTVTRCHCHPPCLPCVFNCRLQACKSKGHQGNMTPTF